MSPTRTASRGSPRRGARPRRAPACTDASRARPTARGSQGRFEERARPRRRADRAARGARRGAARSRWSSRWLVAAARVAPRVRRRRTAPAPRALAALVRRVPRTPARQEVLESIAALRIPAPALQALAPRLPPAAPGRGRPHRHRRARRSTRARAKALAALGEPTARGRRRARGSRVVARRRAVRRARARPRRGPARARARQAARDPVVARRLEAWMARVEPGDVAAALRAVHEVADPERRAAALARRSSRCCPRSGSPKRRAEARGLARARSASRLGAGRRCGSPPAQQLAAAQEIATLFHDVETYDGAWLRALARFAVASSRAGREPWADVALGLIDQFPPATMTRSRALELLASGGRAASSSVSAGSTTTGRASCSRRSPSASRTGRCERALEIANPWYRAGCSPPLDQFDRRSRRSSRRRPTTGATSRRSAIPAATRSCAQFVALASPSAPVTCSPSWRSTSARSSARRRCSRSRRRCRRAVARRGRRIGAA